MGQGAGSRVGTRRFQAMGQLHSTCTQPHRGDRLSSLNTLTKASLTNGASFASQSVAGKGKLGLPLLSVARSSSLPPVNPPHKNALAIPSPPPAPPLHHQNANLVCSPLTSWPLAPSNVEIGKQGRNKTSPKFSAVSKRWGKRERGRGRTFQTLTAQRGADPRVK